MQEFRINNYITLKLKGKKTVIYIANERYLQCMRLLLQMPKNEISSYENIGSIEEAAEVYKILHEDEINEEYYSNIITPQQEFMAHCSNMQVWAENNYNSNFLHINLAFPLLKKLSEVGDSIAKKVFKEEIVKRLESGNLTVLEFLIKEKYINNLNHEEIISSVLVPEEAELIFSLEELINKSIHVITNMENEADKENFFMVKNKHVIELYLNSPNLNLNTLVQLIKSLKFLETLNILSENLTLISDNIDNLISLKRLVICSHRLKKVSESIGCLRNLEFLSLGNRLSEIPASISYLKRLKKLFLDHNELNYIPESLYTLINLNVLILEYNNFKTISDSIWKLENLETLSIHHNPIEKLPDSLFTLNKLKVIFLSKDSKKKLSKEFLNKLKRKGIDIFVI